MVCNVGVATLPVGFLTSCHIASRDFSWLVLVSDSASRREASRRSASVCQCRILWRPRLMFATDGLSRRHDNRRWDARRRFAYVVSCGFPGVMKLRLRDDRRCDARRCFASVLSFTFTKLTHAIRGIFCGRLDGRCRFVSILSYGVSVLLLA
jgi:hypothetical protein